MYSVPVGALPSPPPTAPPAFIAVGDCHAITPSPLVWCCVASGGARYQHAARCQAMNSCPERGARFVVHCSRGARAVAGQQQHRRSEKGGIRSAQQCAHNSRSTQQYRVTRWRLALLKGAGRDCTAPRQDALPIWYLAPICICVGCSVSVQRTDARWTTWQSLCYLQNVLTPF